MNLSLRRVGKGWLLANYDGDGYGDVIRAVTMTGWYCIPRSMPHPAMRLHKTRRKAKEAAEALSLELSMLGRGSINCT